MHDPIAAPPSIVKSTQSLASLLSLRTLPLHTHEILPSFGLYTFLDLALVPRLSHSLFPKTYRPLSRRQKLNWNTRVVSLLQSCFINAAALWVIYRDKERWAFGAKERVWGYTGAGSMVQGFSAGYFLWDLMTSALHVDVHGPGSLAHAASAVAVSLLGFRPFVNYYGVNLILYELSTPFLQFHWFLDKFGMTGSTAQLINGIVLITTFGCSRLLWGTYQSIKMYRDIWEAYNLPGGLPVPSWLALTYVVANSTLCGLNYYWFGRMVKTVMARFKKADESSKKEE